VGIGQGALEELGMKKSFWAGRRVFLTGHTGFKGSWLSLWLQSMGADVTGYALAPEPGGRSLFELARVGDGMRSVIADLRDAEVLARELKAARPDIVIHMAAQALVRESYAVPLETYAVNVMGTAHLLDAVRHATGVRAVVSVTTDKCYENREWAWGYRETDHLGGFDPYSSSKAAAELVTAAYRSSFFNPALHAQHGVAIATARAGNVIGGGDWARDRLVPDIMAALGGGEPVRIRNPEAIRPWQHVLEPLSGYLRLAEALASPDGAGFAEAWNFGPADDDAQPVQWIVEQLLERWGDSPGWTRDATPQPHEAHYLKLDCSKARSRLGWTPHWNLATAIAAIVDWQRAVASGGDARAITLAQISTHPSMCS
jgi:CDP-glucose 4,6-dehydratase